RSTVPSPCSPGRVLSSASHRGLGSSFGAPVPPRRRILGSMKLRAWVPLVALAALAACLFVGACGSDDEHAASPASGSDASVTADAPAPPPGDDGGADAAVPVTADAEVAIDATPDAAPFGDPTGTTAVPLAKFLDSLGVCTHVAQGVDAPDASAAAMAYAGLHNLRD